MTMVDLQIGCTFQNFASRWDFPTAQFPGVGEAFDLTSSKGPPPSLLPQVVHSRVPLLLCCASPAGQVHCRWIGGALARHTQQWPTLSGMWPFENVRFSPYRVVRVQASLPAPVFTQQSLYFFLSSLLKYIQRREMGRCWSKGTKIQLHGMSKSWRSTVQQGDYG